MSAQIGMRLRAALESRAMSIRAFTRRTKEAKVKGGSYPNVHKILAGEVKSPIPLLEFAAELLNVRFQWLITGEGGMTEDEDRLIRRRDADTGKLDRRSAEAGISEAFPIYPALSFAVRNTVIHAVHLHFGQAYLKHQIPLSSLSDPSVKRDFGIRIGRVLNSAFAELKVDPAEIDDVQLNSYVFAVAQALFMMVSKRPGSTSRKGWSETINQVSGYGPVSSDDDVVQAVHSNRENTSGADDLS